MKHKKNADTYCYLLRVNVKKKMKKHSLPVQALKKCKTRRILGITYHNIYRIPKINFQQNSNLHEVYLSYFQLIKKLKRFHVRFVRKWILKTCSKRLQKVLSNLNSFVAINILLCYDCFNKDWGCLHPTPFTVLG